MMEVTEELAQEVADAARLLDDERDFDATLQRLVRLTVRLVPGCDAAGLLVADRGAPSSAAVSSEPVARCQALQLRLGEGPVLEAMRYGEPRRVDDLSAEERWPAFRGEAVDLGVRSLLVLPLRPPGTTRAVWLYSLRAGTFEGVAHELALLLAATDGAGLDNATLYQATRRLTEQLRTALTSRAVIEQAKGVLVAREGGTPEEAFETLRRASQQANVRVRDIAVRVVEAAAQDQSG